MAGRPGGHVIPPWLGSLVDIEGLIVDEPFLYAASGHSPAAAQTADTFSFKWAQSQTFERAEFRDNSGTWYIEKYGPLTDDAWWAECRSRVGRPTVVEIGPGAGVSAEYLLGERLAEVNYLGIDISTAIHTANDCLRRLGGTPWFLQADVLAAPLKPQSADLVFSEGVLHHTDDTRRAVSTAARLVRPGGRLAFYVYRKKAPMREFADDLIRSALVELNAEDAWKALEPLTRLGIALGELNTTIKVPADVELLGITAGEYDLQRFMYWFFFKAYYRPEFTLDEMNHINFDWYTPRNCHRHTPEEVRSWVDQEGFEIEWFRPEEAGITVVARRPG